MSVESLVILRGSDRSGTQGCQDAILLLGKKPDATEIAADLEISSKLQAAIAVFAKTIKDLEYEATSKDG